jgi:hypothetical protein
MNFLLWGLTLGTVGKMVLGIAVLRVHIRMLQEHGIDGIVIKAIKREHILTVFSLLLIVIGYVLEVLFYSGYTEFFECVGSECVAAIDAAFTE